MSRFITPLTWPGGKSKQWNLIKSYFPKNTKEMVYVEPFFGGGSVGLNSLRENLFKKYIFKDNNAELISFWKNITSISKKMTRHLFWPNITLQKLGEKLNKMLVSNCECCGLLNDESQGIELLVNNNLNFNGLLCGTWSQKRLEQNWNQNKLERLKKCNDLIIKNLNKITFKKSDFFEDLISSNKKFYYLDPPYYGVNINLYGTKFSEYGWESFLIKLNEINSKGNLFCLSINDCPQTRELFKNYNIYTEKWKYTSSNTKKAL